MSDKIIIKGAKENNLKNVDVEIPKNKLVVITGVSGSGKSSLAFNTLYEEGKRRYMESLSSYARMFLGGNEKPNVQSIDGLCPAISIDQKTTSHNPRSTVGTVTEIYDYLRVLFARIGKPHCPHGHGLIETLTAKQIKDKIFANLNEGQKLILLAPIATNQKGTFADEFEVLRKEGFIRVRVDGNEYNLDEEIKIDKNKFHNVQIIIDRIVIHKDIETETRITHGIQAAIEKGDNTIVTLVDEKETLYSASHTCKVCGFAVPELEPRLFSFNSPTGACQECKGLGFTYEPDEHKMIPNDSLSIEEGGIDYFKNTINTTSVDWMSFDCLLKHYKIRKDVPIKSLTKKEREIILYGSPEPISCSITSKSGNTFNKHGIVEGVLSLIKRRHLETGSEDSRAYYSKYISMKQCAHCHGNKLNEAALSVKINGKNITEITSLTIQNAINFFLNIKLTATEKQIAELVLKEILDRLSFLNDVGLNYLSLERSANTLSGGEAQRIRLATQIGSNLTGVLYVLDEPSIGLHQKDNSMLIKSLKKMRDIGNSIVVVEHDLETIEESDYVIEVGPNAGIYGGTITAAGTPKEIAANKKSITGQYLSGATSIPIPKTRRSGNGKRIIIKGIKTNNLKNIDVTIPMGKMIAITGVSGSGKSTLINEVLIPNIQKRLFDPFISAPEVKSIVGIAEVDKIISVTQQPIGQTPRSNPATYVGVFDDIRELYTQIPEAKSRGYTKSRFSFNVPGGRCEKCNGDGVIRIEMLFLPNVHIVCDECDGKKYNEDTLQIKYRGKSISDVLEMNVVEALEFFDKVPNIHHKLSLLNDVGLGYIKLGMSADKLSGGEAQRIKLAKFLQKRTSPNTILVLDEPTTGLHLDDIKKLILILDRIANSGATVIIIEHNLDLIKCVDHIIDLGPDGGEGGGEIIVSGTPEQICENKDSYTAQYLKKILQNKSLKFKK